MTMEGTIFLTSAVTLSALLGFFFTVGMWAFCKAFKWAPVNLTVNVCQHDAE